MSLSSSKLMNHSEVFGFPKSQCELSLASSGQQLHYSVPCIYHCLFYMRRNAHVSPGAFARQSQECCTGFFCMSRVWNEGLGAQCSFPRRPGGLPSPSPTCMRCFVTTAIFSVQRLGTLMSVDIRRSCHETTVRPRESLKRTKEKPLMICRIVI